jgi:hypothetical protein
MPTDGRLLPRWARHGIKQLATLPGVARHSELLARFHWQARLAEGTRSYRNVPVFSSREDLYSYVSRVRFHDGTQAIDLFEFGVYRGASLRAWTSLNRNSTSRFWGFDSFQGLPEDWHEGKKKGVFGTGGDLPQIEDNRVQFVAGWFQDTLPAFLEKYEPRNPLVIHCDCDLYSSTLYCLTVADRLLPGAIVIFDDFYDSLHQYRALTDYCCAYRRSYKPVALSERMAQAAVEIT